MRQAMYDAELLAQLDREADAAVLPQQELLNCLAEAEDAVRVQNQPVLERTGALVAAGKAVVLRFYPYHCKSTDAVAGELASIAAVLNTDDVEGWFANLEANFGYAVPDESRYEVRGGHPIAALTVDVNAGSDDFNLF